MLYYIWYNINSIQQIIYVKWKGLYMIFKIRNILRWIFFILGGVFVLMKFVESKSGREIPEDEGFQTAEFDDIW